MKMDRRRFVVRSAAAVASLPHLRAFAETSSAAATLKLHPERPGSKVPSNFLGLSYETEQLSDPTFFSAQNTGLVAQFRALTPHGVLRLGGNTSDVGWWKPTPSTPKPPMNVRTVAGEANASLAYAIEPVSITNLRGFLDATGWTCIFGINLGTNTPERAADEAAFVSKILGWAYDGKGGKLEYFQIGNEPDLFSRHMRDPTTWNANIYFDEWLASADAIVMRVHEARFGLPDTAGNPEWYATIVDRLIAIKTKSESCDAWCGHLHACSCTAPISPRIAALSHHYYVGGPPSNPDMTIAKILGHAPKVQQLANDIRAATARFDAAATRSDADLGPLGPMQMPYRMTEGNTCFRGGKPGVSDVFAAALWAADYVLTLAANGYAGVNLHGGDGQVIAHGLGGTLPGDELVRASHGDPATHPHPYYTPIAHIGSDYVLEPVGYGMKFVAEFQGATMLAVDFNPGSVNATAYAARLPTGQIVLAILNKDATQPLHVDVPGFSLSSVLSASGLEARTVHIDEPDTYREVSTVAPASAVLLRSARG
jgi:hypothetical protein